MTDRLIRITTALAVLMVASVAAIISYQHAHEFVTMHGETGFTARLPFTMEGLIWASSMFSRGLQPVARRCTTRFAESFCKPLAPTLEQAVRDLHAAGRSQRSIATDLSIGRRKVKQIIDIQAA